MKAGRALAAALTTALLFTSSVSAGAVRPAGRTATLANDPTPTMIGPISTSLDPTPVGHSAKLSVIVTPTIGIVATVSWFRIDGADEIPLGTVPLEIVNHVSVATLDLPTDLPEGAYTVIARLDGSEFFAESTSDEFTQHVGPRASKTTLTITGLVSGEALAFARDEQIIVKGQTTDTGVLMGFPPSGETSILVDGTPVASNTTTVTVELDTTNLSLGQHTIEALYGGGSDHDPSSASAVITLVAGSVDATGVKLDATTFYPIKDGYRDVVKAIGTRLEPASVAVVVYDSKGTVRQRLAVAMGSGAYAASWNGRTSSGTLRAAGKYRVVQTLTDSLGTKRSVTSYVNLSKRKLVFKTIYVTKKGTSISAKGTVGTGRITASSSGYLKMTAGSSLGSWAGAGWKFTLPSAVYYKSMSFQVDAIAPASTGQNLIGLQDFRSCPLATGTWDEACFGRWKSVRSSGLKWHVASGASYNRSGRSVRGTITVRGLDVKVYKARVKIVYGVWAK